MHWYLEINGVNQILYYTERPYFSFKDGKVWLKKAKWSSINIELPTRPLDIVNEWIDSKKTENIIIKRMMKTDLLEAFMLFDARINSCVKTISRVLKQEVIRVVVVYKHAQKINKVK